MKEKSKLKVNIKGMLLKLFSKDFDKRLSRANKTYKMIKSSTEGRLSHFYNEKGDKIRGYYKRPTHFANLLPTNPLIVKYNP